MKKATKRLVISAMILVVTLSLAITSTYAWFTMSTDPTVEDFNVNVTTRDGLYVSTSATGEFKNYISAADAIAALLNSDGTNLDSAKDVLTAVTSNNGIDFAYLFGRDLINGENNGQEINPIDPSTGSKQFNEMKYVDLPVYFRSLDPYTVYLASLNVTGAQGKPITYNNKTISADAANALRFAVLDAGKTVGKVFDPKASATANGANGAVDANNAWDYYKYMTNFKSFIDFVPEARDFMPTVNTVFASADAVLAAINAAFPKADVVKNAVTVAEAVAKAADTAVNAGAVTDRDELVAAVAALNNEYAAACNAYLNGAGKDETVIATLKTGCTDAIVAAYKAALITVMDDLLIADAGNTYASLSKTELTDDSASTTIDALSAIANDTVDASNAVAAKAAIASITGDYKDVCDTYLTDTANATTTVADLKSECDKAVTTKVIANLKTALAAGVTANEAYAVACNTYLNGTGAALTVLADLEAGVIAAIETVAEKAGTNDYKDPTATLDDEVLTLVKNDNSGYYTGMITVRIWLEGWDSDCFNSILGLKMSIGLQFDGVNTAYYTNP